MRFTGDWVPTHASNKLDNPEGCHLIRHPHITQTPSLICLSSLSASGCILSSTMSRSVQTMEILLISVARNPGSSSSAMDACASRR